MRMISQRSSTVERLERWNHFPSTVKVQLTLAFVEAVIYGTISLDRSSCKLLLFFFLLWLFVYKRWTRVYIFRIPSLPNAKRNGSFENRREKEEEFSTSIHAKIQISMPTRGGESQY